jgi:hypothetical protein
MKFVEKKEDEGQPFTRFLEYDDFIDPHWEFYWGKYRFSIEYSFSSSWRNIVPGLRVVAKKFPEVEIKYTFSDETSGGSCMAFIGDKEKVLHSWKYVCTCCDQRISELRCPCFDDPEYDEKLHCIGCCPHSDGDEFFVMGQKPCPVCGWYC